MTIKYLVCLVIFFQYVFSEEKSTNSSKKLIDFDYVENYLTKEAHWCESHGASGNFLGSGLLYYTLAYMSKSKLCVCLGSGGGFVPRLMRQAQRDLNLENSKTILVDGNCGSWGTPQWLSSEHFFKKNFPDIEVIIDLTKNVARQYTDWKIDYLHIDADHSFEGALADFKDYLPLMKSPSIITFHDTNGNLPCGKVIDFLRHKGYQVVNFKEFGEGIAIIHLP